MKKICTICGQEKETKDFYFTKATSKYISECKECSKKRTHKNSNLKYKKRYTKDENFRKEEIRKKTLYYKEKYKNPEFRKKEAIRKALWWKKKQKK